jgi:redox-sensitive bicupin YhaK (pirin superfamily)
MDGAGVKLTRVLGKPTIEAFDPFLMLDGFDSANPDDYIKGFPWHPHRGIETVTYLVSGEMEHGDSLGNSGVISDLGCQWMTAGSGIIHQEMPMASPRMLGCQLWINLPAKDKMTQPSYGDIVAENVPVVKEEGAEVRVVADSYKGTKGAFDGKYVKVKYLDVKLEPNKEWSYNEAANDETLFIYLLDGAIAPDISKEEFEAKGCAILFESEDINSSNEDFIRVKSGASGARFVLLAAKPLQEPVVWGGPIVMNTREELHLAFEELNNNNFIKHK